MTLGWEDFPAGTAVRTAGVTVTESHLAQFSALTGDFHPVHCDAEWAVQGAFGSRVAQGALSFALAVGQMYQSRFFGDTIIAWLGADRLRAIGPVKIGDTLHVVARVTRARAASDPARGLVDLDYVVRNQREEDVMTLSLTMLMRARGRVCDAATS